MVAILGRRFNFNYYEDVTSFFAVTSGLVEKSFIEIGKWNGDDFSDALEPCFLS